MINKSHFTAAPSANVSSYRSSLRLALLGILLISGVFIVPRASSTDGPAVSPKFEGSLDKVEVGSVGGWAWDGTRPATPIQVEVYDGKKLLSTITASEFREDLKNAGKGDGKHAFNYAFPATLRDGESHRICVRFAGTTTELPGSPKTLLFPKP
jgi:hypothetical protein